MADLIERQDAIDLTYAETVSTNPEHFKSSEKFIGFMDDVDISEFGRWQWANGFNTALVATKIQLEKLPSTSAESRKKGKWILDEDPHDGDCRCSACLIAIDQMHERNHGLLNALTGGKWWTFYKYCPNCGCQMDGGEEE